MSSGVWGLKTLVLHLPDLHRKYQARTWAVSHWRRRHCPEFRLWISVLVWQDENAHCQGTPPASCGSSLTGDYGHINVCNLYIVNVCIPFPSPCSARPGQGVPTHAVIPAAFAFRDLLAGRLLGNGTMTLSHAQAGVSCVDQERWKSQMQPWRGVESFHVPCVGQGKRLNPPISHGTAGICSTTSSYAPFVVVHIGKLQIVLHSSLYWRFWLEVCVHNPFGVLICMCVYIYVYICACICMCIYIYI